MLCCCLHDVNGTDTKAGICLLVRDGFLVTFSPLLFEDDLHLALGVLDDSCCDINVFWRDGGVAA